MRIGKLPGKLSRLLAGFVCALGLAAASTGGALASADCDALNANFTFTGAVAGPNPFFQALNGGANFSLDPGDALKFLFTVPAGGTITGGFGADTVTTDNLAGGTTVTETKTITSPNTGGQTTGPINISGRVTNVTTVTATVTCTSASSTPPSTPPSTPSPTPGSTSDFGSQIDRVLQSSVPGTDLFGAFGVPDVANFCDEIEGKLLRAAFSAEDQTSSELVRMRQAFLLFCVEDDFADPPLPDEDPCAEWVAAVEAARERLRELTEKGNSDVDTPTLDGLLTGEASLEAMLAKDANLAREIQAALAVFDLAQTTLDACRESGGFAYVPVQSTRPGTTSPTSALSAAHALGAPSSSNPVEDAFAALNVLALNGNGVTAGGSLNDLRATAAANGGELDGLLGDFRFNAWFDADLTFHIDNGAGFGQNGTTIAAKGGLSYLLTPDLNAGLAWRFGHTERSGTSGSTTVDAWSIAAFGQAQLPQDIVLEAIASYTRLGIGASFVTGGATITGGAAGNSYAGQVRASKDFTVGQWVVTPQASASVVNLQRGAFTASNGTTVAASNSTQVSLSGAIRAETQIFVDNGGSGLVLNPNFGLGGYYNAVPFAALVNTAGTTVPGSLGGLTADAGLDIHLGNGMALGMNAGVSGLLDGQTNLSVSGTVGGRF